MVDDIDIYCPTCFAVPGELCRSAYWIRGDNAVVPVICKTHSARLLGSQRHALNHSLAVRLLAAALTAFRGN